MRSRKVQRTKDKGQSSGSAVHSPLSIVQSPKLDFGGRALVVLAGLAAVALFAGCDLLNSLLDNTPPTCQITSPADSASVSGVVQLAATATDSVGVVVVVFYADGLTVAADSSLPYTGSWDASAATEGSWHSLSCVAYDLARNQGFSDTVAVVIAGVGQTSIYHGELEVPAQGREAVSFDAAVGDTLVGDAQVVAGGTLSSFMWLDDDNYQKYVANQTYTVLFQQDNFSQMSMSQVVPAAGKFYIVFANAGNAAVKCWARFVLE